MENKTLRIIIADDHEIFRGGLKALFETLDNIELVAEAANGQELINILDKNECDIIFMDIKMPVIDGIEATKIISQKYPEIKIIALTAYFDEENIKRIFETNVKGILFKNNKIGQIETALKNVIEGSSYYSEEVFAYVSKFREENQKDIKLTKRELQVLQLIKQGYSNKKIAIKLFISPKAVEYHKSNLLKKTDSKNLFQLADYVIKNEVYNTQK